MRGGGILLLTRIFPHPGGAPLLPPHALWLVLTANRLGLARAASYFYYQAYDAKHAQRTNEAGAREGRVVQRGLVGMVSPEREWGGRGTRGLPQT